MTIKWDFEDINKVEARLKFTKLNSSIRKKWRYRISDPSFYLKKSRQAEKIISRITRKKEIMKELKSKKLKIEPQ